MRGARHGRSRTDRNRIGGREIVSESLLLELCNRVAGSQRALPAKFENKKGQKKAKS